MKLATWNVNSLKARLPRVLELLDEHRPDVLCLQETKCEPAAFPHAGCAARRPERDSRRSSPAGLIDAFRELHPEDAGFTWWDYRQGHFHRRMGLRIDYALLGAEHADRIGSCGIDRSFRMGPKPSDHAPLLICLCDT